MQTTRRPRRRIEIQFSTVGGVLIFKFDQNRLSSSRDVRGQILTYCIALENGLCLQPCTRLLYRCDDGAVRQCAKRVHPLPASHAPQTLIALAVQLLHSSSCQKPTSTPL